MLLRMFKKIKRKDAIVDVPDLSERGRAILRAERERYAEILMKRLQCKHGRELGAAKYAEMIALVEVYYYFGQRLRDHMLRVSLVLTNRGQLRLRGRLLLIEDVMR